ncbi:MAG: hypothetical protein ACTHOE_07710 [Conexibacter sp.]
MALIRIYFESMAGTHLLDAIDALRSSGSFDALYGEGSRADCGDWDYPDWDIADQIAEGRRMAYSRHALLFAAFAMEGYANDFVFEHVDDEADRKPLLWMSTPEKLVLLPRLLDAGTPLDRGQEPWSTVRWLFRRRDELVHAKTLDRSRRLVGENPAVHNPLRAAKAITAVAEAAMRLKPVPESVAGTVTAEREWFLSFGRRAHRRLPRPSDPVVADLYEAARRRRRA